MPKQKIALTVDGVSYACYPAPGVARRYLVAGLGSVTLSSSGEVVDAIPVLPDTAPLLAKLAPVLAGHVRTRP